MNETLWIITKQAISQYAKSVENMETLYFADEDAKKFGYDCVISPTSFCAQYQMFQHPNFKIPKGGVHTKQKMSFLNPIQAGDYIFARTEVICSKDSKDRDQIIYITEFVNQNDIIVCRGEMTNLLPDSK